MIRGFYSATSGMVAQQTGMDAIANNIANVSTPGFKPSHGGFAALLHNNINGGAGKINMGHGVRIENTGINLTQGDLIRTDMEYDYAIVGKGFFALEGADQDDRVYKRDGSFQLSQAGGKNYLADSNGRFVLDKNGNRMEVGENFDPNNIGVYKFSNPYALILGGGNGFLETEASGKAEIVSDPIVKNGYLESSSVSAAEEMVKMIETSKAFSLNSKVVQTADEMEKTINQLR